ncbi:hypothetical protein ACTQ4E_15950, partial [Lawsonibacter sp. LCP25S3_G6]|uniref:hypothetical protein n=1 Tax=unclassified Lawsonibacter TaxID=2617946 RepID=UPI003F9480AD
TDGRRFTPFGMERLRRLRWNGRTVPPERALRLTGIRKRKTGRYLFNHFHFERETNGMEEYMLFRLIIAGSTTGLFVLVMGMYKGLQVMVKVHHAKKK